MARPRILTKCVADRYSAKEERIVEFTFPDGSGGLISFYPLDKKNIVNLYCLDKKIKVVTSKK